MTRSLVLTFYESIKFDTYYYYHTKGGIHEF